MFCTSLRRRSFDFASILPKLTSPSSLSLRENDLATHDFAIYIGPKAGPDTRQLRVLLLSPSSVSDSKLGHTIERIRHLVHLTGGQGIAIAFLICPPLGARISAARALIEPSEDHGTNGMLAYCKLQAQILSYPELSLPILPLSTLDALPALLQNHLKAIASPMKVQPPVTTPVHLIQHCTTTSPLSQQTAFVLSDSFGNIRQLAEGCCMVLNDAPDSSSSSSFPEPTLQDHGEDSRKKLNRLRDLIDDKEWENMVVFWQQEWAME